MLTFTSPNQLHGLSDSDIVNLLCSSPGTLLWCGKLE